MGIYDMKSAMGPEIKTNPLYGHGVPVIDLSDFPYLTESAKQEKEEEEPVKINSADDTVTDYTDVIRDSAFLGELPFDTILEGIENQFKDYIGTEDKTNYAEAFYDQIYASYNSIDDEVEHPAEIREVLDDYMNTFVSKMGELFEKRLCITLNDLEGEDISPEQLQYQITVLYEYFILNAKENFRKAITSDICTKIDPHITDDREFFKTVNNMMRYYSPLVMAVGPIEFLRLTGDTEICELYDEGKISGNFLKKYSPRFYQYEDFESDVIADITLKMQTKAELVKDIGSI